MVDIDLNNNGIKQAKNLHEELKNIKFDIVFSSTLKGHIRQHKLSVIMILMNFVQQMNGIAVIN